MKTRLLPGWTLALVLTACPLANGFAQADAKLSPATESGGKSSAGSFSAASAAPDTAGVGRQSLPSGRYVSPWFKQVVKMAEAGIDDNVLLAFVVYSAGTFNLSSDQIIHLNDLNVASEVVAAMIQHDQTLSSGAQSSTASTVPMNPATFAAIPPAPVDAALPPATGPQPDENGARATSSGAILAVNDEPRPGAEPAPSRPPAAAAKPPPTFPVRLPEPEQITDPIRWPKPLAASMVNILRIEIFPAR